MPDERYLVIIVSPVFGHVRRNEQCVAAQGYLVCAQHGGRMAAEIFGPLKCCFGFQMLSGCLTWMGQNARIYAVLGAV